MTIIKEKKMCVEVVNMKTDKDGNYPDNVPVYKKSGDSWLSNWITHFEEDSNASGDNQFYNCANILCPNIASNGGHVQRYKIIDKKTTPVGRAYITPLCTECNSIGKAKSIYSSTDIFSVDKEDLIPVSICEYPFED